jgi:penicillin-binding protein 1C
MKLRLRSAAIVLGLALGAMAGAALSPTACCRRRSSASTSVSTLVLDRDQRVLRAYTTRRARGGCRRPCAGRSEVLALPAGVRGSAFPHASGVDALAAGRATWQAVSHGRIVSGASTLTMQLARLMEPSPRTLGAKLRGDGPCAADRAALSKDEILAAYLTFCALWR